VELQPVPRCPVCASDARHLIRSSRDRLAAEDGQRWPLWRCHQCGGAWIDPRPSDDSLHEAYRGYYTRVSPGVEPDPVGAIAHARRALRNGFVNAELGYALRPAMPGLLARAALRGSPHLRGQILRSFRHLPGGGRVLDVGCGNGTFVVQARRAGWDAVGIDIDAEAVAKGGEHGLDVRKETLDEHVAGNARAYDIVTMAHVIEHVADPVGFLRAARRALKPGGTLWLATPNIGALGHRLFGAAWIGLDLPRHLVLFDTRSLRTALRTAGFADVRDMPHDDNAAPQFAWSATIAAGGKPDLFEPAPLSKPMRVRAAVADRLGRRNPTLAEELVVLATAEPGVSEGAVKG
jgi:2-polyprenyl-3-methyl-5-hydroxy-6-metoxy-1,4-benzoquinol methylase